MGAKVERNEMKTNWRSVVLESFSTCTANDDVVWYDLHALFPFMFIDWDVW